MMHTHYLEQQHHTCMERNVKCYGSGVTAVETGRLCPFYRVFFREMNISYNCG